MGHRVQRDLALAIGRRVAEFQCDKAVGGLVAGQRDQQSDIPGYSQN